jgi:metal-responsive CopG/Arc/MetJ family transcriptional regulator
MSITARKSRDSIVRQSVSLPAPVARRVKALARRRRSSATKVVAQLIETGLEAAENERRRFFELADKLIQSKNPVERKQAKEELARLTFGA